LQGVALPLWILHYTKVPTWWISVLFVINTVVVTLLQVQVSKGGGDLRSSANKFRLGTVYLLGCCFVYSVSGNLDPWLTATILVIGMLIHTIGELYTAAGSWTIGFELAVEEHMGQYQGVYSLGWGLGGTFGPYTVTALAIGLGMTGWWIIGVAFLLAGVAMHALIQGHSAAQKQA
jgi:MFS family permease